MSSLFGRMLASLSIQAKILLFIMPLAILIVAIATVSLLTGTMIGHQIEGTGQSIGVLSDFKQTYAEMNAFLADATPQGRDKLIADLNKSAAEISKAAVAEKDATTAILSETRAIVEGLVPRVEDLWKVHATETTLDSKIRSDLSVLTSRRDDMQRLTDQAQNKLKEQTNEAKELIGKAELLSKSTDSLTKILTRIAAAKDPKAMVNTIRMLKASIADLTSKIESAIPVEEKATGAAIKEGLLKIVDIAVGSDVQDGAVQNIVPLVSDLQAATSRLKDLSGRLAQAGTQKFSKLDKPISEASAISDYNAKVRLSTNKVILAVTTLLGRRDTQHLKDAQDAIDAMLGELTNVPAVSNGDRVQELALAAATVGQGLSTSSADLVKAETNRSKSFASAAQDIDEAWKRIVSYANDQREVARNATGKAMTISMSAAAFAVVFAILATLALVGALKGPIRKLTAAMKDVANGKLDTDLAGADRRDEIGDMARALGVFRSNAEDKLRFEAEAERNRQRAEAEREAAETQKERSSQLLRLAIDSLASSLRSLAHGDLMCTIDTPFSGELDELRLNFNESVQHMRDTLVNIRDAAVSIHEKSGVLNDSVEDLARRTEQQAASLEETAAAVDEMTSTVKMSSARAVETDRVAAEIIADAQNSGQVVTEAIGAMSRIEAASDEISQIISVIDNIAFQTNLLALNAGVEAARAGDAGKGFAVVAQEVRELAQRSAAASKQIRELISRSNNEVKGGVQLVGETGEVIERINIRLKDISRNISDMARAAQEQSTGLQEVNTAINSMDQMTQQNAAMVEENNAASHALALEAMQLSDLVSRFRIDLEEKRQKYFAAA